MRARSRSGPMATSGATSQTDRNRLLSVTLDEASIGRGSPDQEHERRVAIYDLVETNSFALPGREEGPYHLHIGLQDGKLVLSVSTPDGHASLSHILSLQPLRSLVKDYLLLCDSYYDAIRSAAPSQIEAVDMGRRALHDEGAGVLGERLRGKIDCDPPTLRRLFTLVTALHWKG
jgi:uncharacterized protein (UPF0262 family)